jgi:RNA polymerase sigma factor (sigma-70 family)
MESIGACKTTRDRERIFDEYLVAAAVTGDRAAWARLVERWQPRLLRHARRVLGDGERARDVVQEAWLEILRGLARLDDVAAFPPWAYRIVTRRCQRLFKRNGRDFLHDEAAVESAEQAPSHQSGDFAAELAIVMAAIETLSAPHRAALGLFYLEGLGIAEIAVALDVAPGTVKTRLMHARNKVRARLGQGNG